jgi:hypothetical protein
MSIKKKVIEVPIEIAFNMEITLSSMDIVTTLILLINEHGIAFHLFVFSFISFINVF